MKELKIKSADGKEYTLAFTRKTVSRMANSGFVVDEIGTKPTVAIPMLFAGAFLKNHPGVKQETVDAIWAELPNKEKLLEVLLEMYVAPIDSLFDEPKEEEKNATWEVVD